MKFILDSFNIHDNMCTVVKDGWTHTIKMNDKLIAWIRSSDGDSPRRMFDWIQSEEGQKYVLSQLN